MPPEEQYNYKEIVRLRDRLHNLRNSVAALELRLSVIEETVRGLDNEVDQMVETGKIANAVANELAQRDEQKSTSEKMGLTKSQLRWAIGIGLASVGVNFVGIISALLHTVGVF